MSGRRAILLTARREVLDRLRSRAFLIATAIQLVVVIAIVAIAAITGEDGEKYDLGVVGTTDGPVVREATAQAAALDAEVTVTEVASASEAEKQLDGGDLDAALDGRRLLVTTSTPDDLSAIIEAAARTTASTEELRRQGLSSAEIERALHPPSLERVEVGSGDEGAGIAWIAALLLYLAIFMAGMSVATGVVEEKSTRVVEVILAAIRPAQLLAGKVLGIGLVALAQVVLTIAVGLGGALATDVVDIPGGTLQLGLLITAYFLLGYILYACAFAAAGALVSRQEDVQSATSPLMIMLIGGYVLSFSAIGTPDSTVAVVCTFIPVFAPMIAPARAAQDALPGWELAISLILMLLTIAALVWLASRVYERAVLRMGAPLGLREVLRLVRAPSAGG